MGQVTIYLDNQIEWKVRAEAKTAQLSISEWISRLIEEKLANQWPEAVVKLAGSWDDFSEIMREEEKVHCVGTSYIKMMTGQKSE